MFRQFFLYSLFKGRIVYVLRDDMKFGLIATCNPPFPLLVSSPLTKMQKMVLCLGLEENKLNPK